MINMQSGPYDRQRSYFVCESWILIHLELFLPDPLLANHTWRRLDRGDASRLQRDYRDSTRDYSDSTRNSSNQRGATREKQASRDEILDPERPGREAEIWKHITVIHVGRAFRHPETSRSTWGSTQERRPTAVTYVVKLLAVMEV